MVACAFCVYVPPCLLRMSVWCVIYCVTSYVLRCLLFVRVPCFVCVQCLCVNTSCVCVRVCEFVCDVVLRFVWGVLFMLMCACVLCTR